jgi:hypothetical protein
MNEQILKEKINLLEFKIKDLLDKLEQCQNKK